MPGRSWFSHSSSHPSPGGMSTQKSLIATMCGPSCAIVPVTSVSPALVWRCTRMRFAYTSSAGPFRSTIFMPRCSATRFAFTIVTFSSLIGPSSP